MEAVSSPIMNLILHHHHYLDITTLTSMDATYPVPSWSTEECQAYDRSIHPSAIITAQWQIPSNPPIKRVCGYVNGYLNNEFSTSAVLSGRQTHFEDPTPSSSSYLSKRVYCVSVEYCSPGSSNIDYTCFWPCPPGSSPSANNPTTCSDPTKGTTIFRGVAPTTASYECAVGLIYDGTPIDLTPRLGQHGVTFSFIDTSSSETRFDIFVGEVGGDDATKTNVVTISTGLAGCGRTANPISFTDQISAMSVGQIVEYGIYATQSYPSGSGTKVAPTEMFKFPYRIPFLVLVSGDVKFKGGSGVQYVNVAFCHLERKTKLPDINPQYCPLITFITDEFGHFAGEIRVSDP